MNALLPVRQAIFIYSYSRVMRAGPGPRVEPLTRLAKKRLRGARPSAMLTFSCLVDVP
jgi:hypothetical protein